MLVGVPEGIAVRVAVGGSEVSDGCISAEAGEAGLFVPAQAVRTAAKNKIMGKSRVFIRSNIS
jgi:hypothetical protein